MKKMNKNIFICALLVVMMLFCVSAVSAEDNALDAALASNDAGDDVVSASGDTIYVDSSYTGDVENGTQDNPYKKISSAVNSDKITGGETIFIKNGDYSESAKISPTKSMSFVGESQDGVKITSSSSTLGVFEMYESGIALSFTNLTFKDVKAGTSSNLPLKIGGDQDVSIINCSFIDCASKFGAFQIYTKATATIENIKIQNFKSTASAGTGGIYLSGNGVYNLKNIEIDGSTFTASSGQMSGIIYVYSSGSPRATANFENLTISNCNGPANSILRSSGNLNVNKAKIINNTVLKSASGYAGEGLFYDQYGMNLTQAVIANNSCPDIALYKTTAADFTMNYCNFMDNTVGGDFTDDSAGDYDANYNYWGSNKLPSGVTASVWVVAKNGAYQLNNGQPLTVDIPELPEPKEDEPAPEIIYVDGDKGLDSNNGDVNTPVKTIKKAVELAQEGNGKVIINAGTYNIENIATTVPLTIGANGTVILDGNGKRAFNVKSGSLNISNITFTNCNETSAGSIICLASGTSATIDGCIFVKNGGEQRNDLIDVNGATLTLTNSVIDQCTSHKTSTTYGGIRVRAQGTLYMDNCNITNNFNKYGFVYVDQSTAEIYNSNFIGNNGTSASQVTGSALYIGGTATSSYSAGKPAYVLVKNCNFINNTAKGSKGSYYDYGGQGGAIYVNNNATLVIEDSYFENNVAESAGTGIGQGGAIYASAGNITITGTVFKDNVAENASAIYLRFYNGGSYSPWATTGNLDVCTVKDSVIISDGVAIFSDNANYTVDVNENFWNSNDDPSSKVSENIAVDNWVILNAEIDPIDAQIGDNVTVTAAFDLLLTDEGPKEYTGKLPDGILVTFTSTSGKLNEIVAVKDGKSVVNYTLDVDDDYITAVVGDAKVDIPLVAGIIFVAPDGNDANVGTEAKPVATIAHAIEIAPKGKIIVKEGTYKTGNLGSISKDLSIAGIGEVVFDAENNNRILYVGQDANVELNGITLINGYTSASDSGALIGNSGYLTLIDCTLANSTSSKNGGAIYNAGYLTVEGCIFENNKASQNGGAIFTQKAGTGVTPTLTVNNTIFSENSADGNGNFGGGAIFVQEAADGLSISNSYFMENYVVKSGGGAVEIVNTNVATIDDCFFIGNYANGEDSDSNYGGGAISFVGSSMDKKETLTITDSLFKANSVDGLGGGAIYVRAATVNVANSVLINNYDDYDYAIYARVTSFVTPSVTANDNWWGSSESPKDLVSNKVTLNRWAVLTVSNDTAFVEGKNVTITADINSYTTGTTTGKLANPIVVPREVTIETSEGTITGELNNGEFSKVYEVPAGLKYVEVSIDSQKEMLYLISTSTTVQVDNITAKKGQRPVYTINVTTSDGTIVNQGEVQLFVADELIAILDVEEGIATYKSVVSLNKGSYDIVAKYVDEEGLFDENFGTATLTVTGTDNYITNANFFDFFDEDGYMYTDIPYTSLYFRDNFDAATLGIDKITITAPMSFTRYSTSYAKFTNITFDIVSSEVTLTRPTITLDGGISGPAINVEADDVTLSYVTINYETVNDTDAFGINVFEADNVKVTNPTINFVSNAIGTPGYNQYAIKIVDSTNVVVSGATINAELPACDVDYYSGAAGIDQDTILVIGVQGGENVTLTNNKITTDVTGTYGSYPTVDSIMANGVTNLVISKNTITQNDFSTKGAGYSNVVDLYTCNDAQVVNNNIFVNSTAGAEGAGTAYPIQLTGPYTGLLIDGNTLTSISCGPTLGIYSQNYAGATDITITNNFINVTGYATNSSAWSLVSGMELQDTQAKIYNNTIYSQNTAAYDDTNFIFGISYAQWLYGDHTFDIRDNAVFTEGKYAVYFLNAKDSNVIGNNLHAHELWGNDAATINSGEGNVIRNNMPPYSAEVIITAPNAFKGYEYVITIAVTNATEGNVALKVNDKEFNLTIVNGTASQVIDFADLIDGINNVSAVYAGSEIVNPGEANATFIIVDGVITNKTFFNYFDENGYLLPTPVGATLDFQGPFVGAKYNVYINQPVNVITTVPDSNGLLSADYANYTGPAIFDSGENPNYNWFKFNVVAGGDNTNISDITIINGDLFVIGASYVTIDNVTMKANMRGVGSGTGFMSIHSEAYYTTVKNCYMENGGTGSSCLVLGNGGKYATFDNNYFNITGSSGNVLSSNVYVGKGNRPEYVNYTNNIVESHVAGSGFMYGITACGSGNIIENNTLINFKGNGIITQYGATSSDNVYRNNTITGGGSMSVGANSLVENNYIAEGAFSAAAGCTVVNNTFKSLTVAGKDVVVADNTVLTTATIAAAATNTTFENNTVNGLLTVNSNNNVITGNEITTTTAYAIDLKSTSNNTVTNNKLASANKMGDDAVSFVEGKNNTVTRNGGNPIMTIDVNNVFVGNNNTITIAIVNATGNVTVKVNGKEFNEVKLTDGAVTILVNASDIVAGVNNVTVTYNGDEYINVGTETTTFRGLDNVVTEDIFYEYFDDYGFLLDEVKFDELIFKGEFNKLSYYIYLDRPIKITGEDALLKDMCIIIDTDNVTIDNLAMKSTMEFGSLITVGGSNVVISNMNITYSIGDASAEIITVDGEDNVKILNNVINFESKIKSDTKSALGINVKDSSNIVIDGNVVNVKYPALYVTIWDELGLANVNAIKAKTVENLTISNNEISAVSNDFTASFPTIQAMLISGVTDGLIDNNNISMIDTLCPEGKASYLYGMNFAKSTGLVISNNNFLLSSKGGQDAAGTAYAIQGTTSEVTIIGNNITSVSNGPNLGIYVASWSGESSELDIENNFIDVTGLVNSSAEWALVSGIEIQNGNAKVYNNTIYTSNVADYGETFYVSGVSYVQYMYGSRSFDIQNNTIVTDGKYTVNVKAGTPANVTGNILYAHELFGDDSVADVTVGIVKNNFPPFDAEIIIDAQTVWIGSDSIITVNVTAGTGNVTLKVGDKIFKELVLVNGSVTQAINASDLIAGANDILVTYNGDNYIVPTNATGNLQVLDGVITNATYEYYFDDGNLVSIVPNGTTLDFQGLFLGKFPVYIDKAVNAISSTGDALFDSGDTFSGNAINSFNIVAGGDNTNITGLSFINYCLYIKGASNVTVDDINMVANKRGVGSGTGFLSIHSNAYYTTIKNSYFENGGTGSSCVVLGKGGKYATFDNNEFNIVGSSGNVLSSNIFVGAGANPEFVNYTNNIIRSNVGASGFMYGITVCGQGNIIENNTLLNFKGNGIINQFGATSTKNIYRNNTITGGGSMAIGTYSLVDNNHIDEGALTVTEGCTFVNNTAKSLTISGKNVVAEDNVVLTTVTISAAAKNTTFTDNIVNGLVTVNSAENNITNNLILATNSEYAIDLKSTANNIVTDNVLYAKELVGDKAVNFVEDKDNTVKDNFPIDPVLVVEAADITVGENATINVSFNENITGTVEVIVDGKKYNVDVTEGKGQLNVSDLAANKYTVGVSYEGDVLYIATTNSTVFEVNKLDVKDSVNVTVPSDVKPGDNVTVDVAVPGATGDVTVIVDGKATVVPLDENGTASVPIDNIGAGDHGVVVMYSGDDTHAPTYKATTVSVEKLDSQLDVTVPSDAKPGDNITVDVAVPGATGNVTVIVDGESTVVPLSEGTASVPIDNIGVGKHGIVVMYSGDDTFAPTYKATSVNVERLGSWFNVTEGTTFETYAVETAVGEQGALYAFVLRDSNGNPIANATVTFAYKTVVFNSTTDENGTLYLGISTYLAQDALCAMSYVGDETHNATFVAFNFKIQKKPTAIKAAAKTYKVSKKYKYLTVTLKTIKGASRDGKTYLKKGKKITLTVNGKTYVGTTNANGKVTFAITNLNKKGKYTAVIRYAGSDTYTSAKTKVKLKVY